MADGGGGATSSTAPASSKLAPSAGFQSLADCGGTVLIERTLRQLASDCDHRLARPAKWDNRLAELTTAVKSRIPQSVEERCRAATTRSNCGLIAAARHAWASADSLLHIWDYRQDSPQVMVVAADSAIVSVDFCAPRAGVFDTDLHLLIVLCTRVSVSLVGLSLMRAAGADPLRPPPQAGPMYQPGLHMLPGASTTGSLRLLPLDGYSAQANGALFHCVTHTPDGHILLSCGAPYVYELAYSKSAGVFSSRCRLVRHMPGFWARVREFLPLLPQAGGRVRIVRAGPNNYVVTVDDANTIRLHGIADKAVHAAESVSVLEELASVTVNELANHYFGLSQVQLCSRIVTHVFPVLGLDGHLRLHVVTAASERLLYTCSADSATGPEAANRQATAPTASGQSPAAAVAGARPEATARSKFHGFWLQHAEQSRLGQGGAASTAAGGGMSAFAARSTGIAGLSDSFLGVQGSATVSRRTSCLEEINEPCSYANGVWVAAAHRPGMKISEVGITARIDDCLGVANGAPGLVNLFTGLTFDSQIFSVVEEANEDAALSDPQGAKMLLKDALLEGEPTSFRSSRTFALFLDHSVQVVRLSLQPQALGRAPASATECCLHLVQMALPAAQNQARAVGVDVTGGAFCWAWSFDDVALPSFDEQLHHATSSAVLAPLHLGRWSEGLLRFLAITLRSVWGAVLVTTIPSRDPLQRHGLQLALGEADVKRLLAQLRPALRFARQGLQQATAPDATPTSCAQRFRMYTKQKKCKQDALRQAKQRLRSVLEVAGRVQEVLGLLSVLHAQRSAYRVLHSSVLAGEALRALGTQPVGSLVTTSETMLPVVQLCTAMAVESGLTTPAAEVVFDSKTYPRPLPGQDGAAVPVSARGGSGASSAVTGRYNQAWTSGSVCAELEEQCPEVFARVDLAFVRTRLGAVSAGVESGIAGRNLIAGPSVEAAGEMLRRYSQCVTVGSHDQNWAALARSVQTMAMEDPNGAADVCVEKLQSLRTSAADGTGSEGGSGVAAANDAVVVRARVLLEALLGSPALERASYSFGDRTATVRAVVDRLLTRTTSLKLPGDDMRPGGPSGVSVVHGLILDIMLCSSRLRPVLESMIDSTATNLDAFLRSKSSENRAAAELHWKLLLQQNRPVCASQVLLQLAERPDPSCSLQARVELLGQARHAASLGHPQSKELSDRLAQQLEVASRVQVPLSHELRLVAGDARLDARWRSAAEEHRRELQELKGLQELYQTAADFGFFHIVLVVADLSASIQERETSASTWLRIFFPTSSAPYSPSSMVVQPAVPLHGLFPTLLSRRCATFFQQSDNVVFLPEAASSQPELLKVRTLRLLEELKAVTRTPSTLWDVRCVGLLLEYCNCLWRQALEADVAGSRPSASSRGLSRPSGSTAPAPPTGDASQMSSPADCSWVASQVLMRRPFELSLKSVLQFYADMLGHMKTWLADLQGMLPDDPSRLRPEPSDQDMAVHIGDVIVELLEVSISKAQARRLGDEAAASELRSAWPAAESALAGLSSQLEGEPSRRSQELLSAVRRIQADGKQALSEEAKAAASAAAAAAASPSSLDGKDFGLLPPPVMMSNEALPQGSLFGLSLGANASTAARSAAAAPAAAAPSTGAALAGSLFGAGFGAIPA
eukprot:TRINITY_DN41875_c0_g1_i1.p1 TRINITY_DN41875_c0_g1~~TRINITY_DN41875_c0_g1_i1.p1  ORF type:complete len:1641 (+),score=362.38 TRINITY_DN41875_c0_g1_i1:83-5005(+)